MKLSTKQYLTMLRNIRQSYPMWMRHFSLSYQTKKVYEINSSIEFKDKVIDSKGIVVVNFHADWCNPCIQLTSKLKELIEPTETLDLVIINLECNPDLADILGLKAVPAVFAMSNGLVVDKFIGFQGVGMVEKFVEKLITNDPLHPKVTGNSVNSQTKDESVNMKVNNDSIDLKDNGIKS